MALAATVTAICVNAIVAAQSTSRGVIVLRPSTVAPNVAPAPIPPVPPRPVPPTPAPPRPTPIVPDVCPRPVAHPELSAPATANGVPVFNKSLARSLKTGRSSVVVDIATPFALDGEAPSALRPWLAAVKGSGGLLTVEQYCQQSRGLISFIRRLLAIDGDKSYREARRYDVIFHADGSLSQVTQVEFRLRHGV